MHRLTHSKPHVEPFFDCVDQRFKQHGLAPATPFTKALKYVRDRRLELRVFLDDPDVPIDTNHLERALRVIPMGRKNWNFRWTELGTKHVGIVQSLITTCRLHEIDVHTYLVDVRQRVGEHPAVRVAELTPRLWKQHFAANPLRSPFPYSHCVGPDAGQLSVTQILRTRARSIRNLPEAWRRFPESQRSLLALGDHVALGTGHSRQVLAACDHRRIRVRRIRKCMPSRHDA